MERMDSTTAPTASPANEKKLSLEAFSAAATQAKQSAREYWQKRGALELY